MDIAPDSPASTARTRPMDLFRAVHAELRSLGASGTAAAEEVERIAAMLRGPMELAPQDADLVRSVFAMAVFADEVLAAAGVASDLKGQLFGPQATVDLLFRQVDDLLLRGSADPDLAAVYLAVLTLAFSAASAQALREAASARRLHLHRLLNGEMPQAARVSARAYAPQDGAAAPPARLPSPRFWWGALAAVVLAFLVGSHLVWTGATDGIARDLGAARAIAENQGVTWSR